MITDILMKIFVKLQNLEVSMSSSCHCLPKDQTGYFSTQFTFYLIALLTEEFILKSSLRNYPKKL